MKTPKSQRSLILPRRAITALRAHKVRQDREREAAGAAWRETGLVFVTEIVYRHVIVPAIQSGATVVDSVLDDEDDDGDERRSALVTIDRREVPETAGPPDLALKPFRHC